MMELYGMCSRRLLLKVIAVACLSSAIPAYGQDEFRVGRIKTRPDASPRAAITQVIGIDSEITVVYHRPAVRGRDVWQEKSLFEQIGRLVPFDGKPRPWRAGANEMTTITFENDVKIEGNLLAAGTYGLAMIPTKKDWTIIFSNRHETWGTFTYREKDDALRVTVQPEIAPHQERLLYGFDEIKTYRANAYVRWADKKVAFQIELADRDKERASQKALADKARGKSAA